MRYDIIWGDSFPMCALGLTRDEAQELINAHDEHGVTYTVTESANVQA